MADSGKPSEGASSSSSSASTAASLSGPPGAAAPGADMDAAFADDPEFAAAWESLQTKTPQEIQARTAALRNNIRLSRLDIINESRRIARQQAELRQLKENLKLNVKLPFLVANIQEVGDELVSL